MRPFQKIHLNGSWFGGHDLDRFTQYQFGMFDDTRIHGVPASGVRYGELAMVRGSYSLNIFEQYRIDLFLDRGWGRDTPGHGVWDPITGFGIAGQRQGAVEYHSARRLRQEHPARPLRRARLDRGAGSPPEAAPMTPMLRADLHVHSCHSKRQREHEVSRQPRLLLDSRPTSIASRRRAAWISSPSPITIRSTARSSC